MWNINTRFDAPHSRYNDISCEQLEQAGLTVLADSYEAGAHLAVSPDQIRIVYFQGHPEYDANSLLKEYKREVFRFLANERADAPRFPENYFPDAAGDIATSYIDEALAERTKGIDSPTFPEAELQALVDNTWGDTGKAIINNWLGLVYQLTNVDRRQQFMPGVNPEDPLKLK